MLSSNSHWVLDLLVEHYEGRRVLGRDDLRIYQNWLVEKMIEEPFIYLAVDMGLGKTIAVLTALIEMERRGLIKWPILIVAPKFVATDTWPDEIRQWAHTQHLTHTVIVGDAEERELARLQPATIHLINYENFQWLRERWGRAFPYRCIVCDEATRIKAGKMRTKAGKGARQDGTPRVGKRTSRFGAIARIRNILDRVILMSGTPAPNGLHDLWGPMYILDRGERLGKSMTAFETRWFDRNPWSHEIKPKPHALEEITDRVKDRMFALKAEDYVDMPPVLPNIIPVHFPPALMKRYKAFERELYDEELDIEAVNAGVLRNKLLQFANGSLYVDEDTAVEVHSLKLDALESIMTEANGHPVLLAYEFRFDLPPILKKFRKARVIGDNKNWIKDWNAGRIPLGVTHPASAGHGLNLQFGGHIGVWYGMQQSLELYQQFILRLARPGQAWPFVIAHHILAKGTADYQAFDDMTEKDATQEQINDRIRVRLEHARRGV